MCSNQTTSARQTRSSGRNRWLALWLIGAALFPALTAAQPQTEPMVTILSSALHTLLDGNSFLVSVVDVGTGASASEVTIEFRDSAGQRRSFKSGLLLPDRPVRLRLSSPAGAVPEQFRVVVTLRAVPNSEASEPIVGLENHDANSIRVETKPPCAPPSVGGGPEGNCDGWRMGQLTAAQAGSSPY